MSQIEEVNLEKVKSHKKLVNKCFCCTCKIELEESNWSAEDTPKPKSAVVVRTHLELIPKKGTFVQFFICLECLLSKPEILNFIDLSEKFPCLITDNGRTIVGDIVNYHILEEQLVEQNGD